MRLAGGIPAMGLVLALLVPAAPSALEGQILTGFDEVGPGNPDRSLREMILDCIGADASPEGVQACQDGALAVAAGRAALGLAASLGGDFPGLAGTLGRRPGGSPRLTFSARGGWVRGTLPDVASGSRDPSKPSSVTVPSVQAAASLSLLDGLSLTPNLGGVLSLDLLAVGGWVGAPGDQGFADDVLAWGLGARLGLLRESFTLPGLSLSWVHRSLGEVSQGDLLAGDRVAAEYGLTVRSLRAVVGKDLRGTGVLAGVGEDRYSGEVLFRVPGGTPGIGLGSASDGPDESRRVYFLGASRTYLVLQFSAEVGWAGGRGLTLVDPSATSYDPGSGSWFWTVASRITL